MSPGEGRAPLIPVTAFPALPAAPTRLIEGEALALGIRVATPAGDAAGSPEAEVRLMALEGLAAADLWRVPFVSDEPTLERLDQLAAGAPNAARAVAIVRHAAALSYATGTALRIPPLVLVGPPGSGKTRLAVALAERWTSPWRW